jgi:hypothetical protein
MPNILREHRYLFLLQYTPYTIYKIFLNYIIKLNVRLNAIQHLEENIGEHLCDLILDQILLDMTEKPDS